LAGCARAANTEFALNVRPRFGFYGSSALLGNDRYPAVDSSAGDRDWLHSGR
jgi:hypothetical protein